MSQLGVINIGDHGGDAAPVQARVLTRPQAHAEAAAPAKPSTPPASKATLTDAGGRRDIFGLDKKSAADLAADKYISEREQKRTKVFDIPKHIRYNFTNDATVFFGGVRQIDGQSLALLKQGDEVMVLPVEDATVRRLKRVKVGEPINVTAKGAIKTKGRSR